jgi:hypothetical protein
MGTGTAYPTSGVVSPDALRYAHGREAR